MKTIRQVAILPEGPIDTETRWAVYDSGKLVARFVSLFSAKAYKLWLEDAE